MIGGDGLINQLHPPAATTQPHSARIEHPYDRAHKNSKGPKVKGANLGRSRRQFEFIAHAESGVDESHEIECAEDFRFDLWHRTEKERNSFSAREHINILTMNIIR